MARMNLRISLFVLIAIMVISASTQITAKFGPRIILYRDVILFTGSEGGLSGLSAESGKMLWTSEHPASGPHSMEDLLVIGGLVWSSATAGGGDSGKKLWSGTTGGRVDSPPTIYQGRVLFGSVDGTITCLGGK